MKKILISALFCSALLVVQAEAAVKSIKKPRAAISAYSVDLSEENLVEDVGPVSREKTVTFDIPEPGLKNGKRVQFQDADGNNHQIYISTKNLTKAQADRHENLTWQEGKGQKVIQVLVAQPEPTAQRAKMNIIAQKDALKSDAKNGKLKVNVKKNGQVSVDMQSNGKSAPVCKFNCNAKA